MAAFRKRWEAPGLVAVVRDALEIKVVMFMRRETREAWLSGHRRTQQYAPPQTLPASTISVFTDGSAIPRKKGQPPPPAGFGFVAVEGGQGREHRGGRALFKRAGQIVARSRRYPQVKTTTNNLAELVAFTEGLDWAFHSWEADGRPILMRYDSKYAAMIATGVWKAKKHKDMAAAARQSWTRLKRAKEGVLWIQHVKGHSGHSWNDTADSLADAGRHGTEVRQHA